MDVRLEEELKQRLPNFQRGNPHMDQYLEAVGEFLDLVREDIDHIKHSSDWVYSSPRQLRSIVEQWGYDFPGEIIEAALRVATRDAVEILRCKGAEKTIKWMFDLIGLDVMIEYAWILNPEQADPDDEITRNSFVYGSDTLYSNGVYFDGNDVFGEQLNKIPIKGEVYPVNKKLSTHEVTKTPYVYLNVDIDDYQDFTSRVGVDSQQLIDTIIASFFNEARPANVVLTVVIQIPDFESDIQHDPEEDLEELEAEGTFIVDENWSNDYVINPNRFGEYYDFIDQGNNVWELNTYYENREEYQNVPRYTNTDTIQTLDEDKYFPVRDNTAVFLDYNIVKGNFQLQASRSSRQQIRQGNATWDNIDILSGDLDQKELALYGNVPFGSATYAGVTKEDEDHQKTDDEELVGTVSSFLVDYNAFRINRDEDFIGRVDIEYDFYSMLHRTIGSYNLGVQFTRNSPARILDSSGNMSIVPENTLRKYYDSRDLELKGYLVEPAATNFVLGSQQLTGEYWATIHGGSRSTTSVDALDGTTFFNISRSSGSLNTAGIRQIIDIDASRQHYFSVYVKQNTTDKAHILLENGDTTELVIFDFDTEEMSNTTLSGVGFGNKDLHFQKHHDGIYRMIFGFESLGTTLDVRLLASYENTSIGQGTYFWAAQLEQDNKTGYIRSNDVPSSRAAEQFYLAQLPTQFQSEGIIMADFNICNSSNAYLIDMSDGTNELTITVNQDSEVSINGTVIYTYTLIQNLSDLDYMFLLVHYSSSGIEYSIGIDENFTTGSLAFGGFSGPVEVGLLNDRNQENGFNGQIYNLYLSNDEFTGPINTLYLQQLLKYRKPTWN